eukprot:CAMPEP_0196592150 /NCGR_PEP_ID=MMETSP1081-20130531/71855_1 /TAXON_ID=36882 /ORGANISM="Pyramimonas amylifera, Strain CCMP720" /LENGTH=163 /DNA_ID=CAMNT_0041915743 /DNA_START=65 /DNA_END=553 /DNA_ORIENTATION=-
MNAFESYEQTQSRDLKDQLGHMSAEIEHGKAERREMLRIMNSMSSRLSEKSGPQSSRPKTLKVHDGQPEVPRSCDQYYPKKCSHKYQSNYDISSPESPNVAFVQNDFRSPYSPGIRSHEQTMPVRKHGGHRTHITHNRKNWSHMDTNESERMRDAYVGASSQW